MHSCMRCARLTLDMHPGLDGLGSLEVTEEPGGRTTVRSVPISIPLLGCMTIHSFTPCLLLTQYTIHVDKNQLGDHAQKITPEKFKINVGPPQGHRAITLSSEGGGKLGVLYSFT